MRNADLHWRWPYSKVTGGEACASFGSVDRFLTTGFVGQGMSPVRGILKLYCGSLLFQWIRCLWRIAWDLEGYKISIYQNYRYHWWVVPYGQKRYMINYNLRAKLSGLLTWKFDLCPSAEHRSSRIGHEALVEPLISINNGVWYEQWSIRRLHHVLLSVELDYLVVMEPRDGVVLAVADAHESKAESYHYSVRGLDQDDRFSIGCWK